MALGLALSAPQPAQAQTTETLLSNLTGGIASSGNCEPTAQGFTTGPGGATILEVTAAGQSITSFEIRADSNGSPAASALYTMTSFTDSGGNRTYTADANTDLAASTTYWVVARGSSCGLRSTVPAVHPTWTAGVTKWKRMDNTGWNPWNGQYLSVEIVGTIHSGPAHEPERADSQQDYEPLPRCSEEQRQWRQRGRELPPACSGGFYHSFEMYPSSDPCDQPWQVPGSYRRDRGCLNRY